MTLTVSSKVLRVLLVDDEETPRDAMEMLLGSMGCDVRSCSSGIEAIGLLEANPDAFDVILTDIRMPGMDGHELIARLRGDQDQEGPAIVAYTGSTVISEVKHADAFLMKPARANQIREAIKNAIAKRGRSDD